MISWRHSFFVLSLKMYPSVSVADTAAWHWHKAEQEGSLHCSAFICVYADVSLSIFLSICTGLL